MTATTCSSRRCLNSLKYWPVANKISWWLYMILIIDLDQTLKFVLPFYVIYISDFHIHNGVLRKSCIKKYFWRQWWPPCAEVDTPPPQHIEILTSGQKISWWLYMILIIDLDQTLKFVLPFWGYLRLHVGEAYTNAMSGKGVHLCLMDHKYQEKGVHLCLMKHKWNINWRAPTPLMWWIPFFWGIFL